MKKLPVKEDVGTKLAVSALDAVTALSAQLAVPNKEPVKLPTPMNEPVNDPVL